jgi:hypothetical protein
MIFLNQLMVTSFDLYLQLNPAAEEFSHTLLFGQILMIIVVPNVMLNNLKAEESQVVILIHPSCQSVHTKLPSCLRILQLLQVCKSLHNKYIILSFCECN